MTGLIPAYAGRTCASWTFFAFLSAHPRLRGADDSSPSTRSAGPGSSPLTRGGRATMTAKLDPTGLIPAYAGRTSTLGVTLVETGAHPRLRGADVHLLLHFQLRDGSSPLTRGGLRVDLSHFGLLGLIPAYAGRTERILTHAETRGAHPRLRGADTMAAQGGFQNGIPNRGQLMTNLLHGHKAQKVSCSDAG